MKKFALRTMMSSALLMSATPVFAADEPQPPLKLAPTSQWVVDFKDDFCQLRRVFGEGDNRSLLVISRYGPDERFRVTLGGNPMKALSKGPVNLQFGPNEGEQQRGYYNAKLADGMFALVLSGEVRLEPATEKQGKDIWGPPPPPVGKAREKAVTYLKVWRSKGIPVILDLGAMDKPFGVLQQCVDDMVSHWGIDMEAHKSLKTIVMPKVSPIEWINTANYPSKMLDEEQSAIVEFRVDVDEKGKPTGCHIQDSTRPKEFDNAVCLPLMRKAKFHPATDASGKPIRSFWKSSVSFRVPD